MGLLKNLLTATGVFFSLVGVGLMFATADTVTAVYGKPPPAKSLFAFATRGTFEIAYGALLVLSRNWGSDERFKIGIVTAGLGLGLIFDVNAHAAASGFEPFSLSNPTYAGLSVLTLLLVVAVVLNKMEPGIFEKDKTGGVRKSTRTRPKRA